MRDELALRLRDLDAERVRPPLTAVPRYLPPVTPAEGRANFLALAESLGGLRQADLDYLAAHPISTDHGSTT